MNTNSRPFRSSKKRAVLSSVSSGFWMPWLPEYITTNASPNPFSSRNVFGLLGIGFRTSSWGQGGSTWSLSGTFSFARTRSLMNRSSTTTARERRKVTRFIQSNSLVSTECGDSFPATTIWSGLRSMTHHTSGTRRIQASIAPPKPANGGLVLTRTKPRPRVKMPRAMACTMKLAWASRRTAIELLPKLENGKRRTSTPSRNSRRGYRWPGSSYPRADV